MTKECLELVFSEIEEKSQRMNMWKGSRKSKSGKIQEKYLKVIIRLSYNVLSIFSVYCWSIDFAIRFCNRNGFQQDVGVQPVAFCTPYFKQN